MKPVDPARRMLVLERPDSGVIADGVVLQVSTKPRTVGAPGLPKVARESIVITLSGAEGDYNHYRATSLAGDPKQAILLMSAEVLSDLNAEGWPANPGDLGENLTLRVPEQSLVPGRRVEVGPVVLEVTLACDPCKELYSLPFVGEERGPQFLRTMTGRRGWYARVVTGGEVRSGMPVRVLDAAATH
jgi:MOSC domain-containing protein YiiM